MKALFYGAPKGRKFELCKEILKLLMTPEALILFEKIEIFLSK